MATYEIQDNKTGKKLEIEWHSDAPPTEYEIDEIFDREFPSKLKKTARTVGSYAQARAQEALVPIKVGLKGYEEERIGGLETMKRGVKEPSWKSLYQVPLGAMQYTASPLTAAGKGLAEPFKRTPKEAYEFAMSPGGNVRVPEQTPEFVGQMVEQLPFFISPGYVAGTIQKGVTPGAKALAKFGGATTSRTLAAKTGKVPEVLKPPPLQTKIPPQIKKITKGAEDLITPKMQDHLVREVTIAGEAAIRGNLDKTKRIFNQIHKSLGYGEVQIEDLPKILKKYNLTPEEFADLYANTVSSGGRVLAYHSHVARRLKHVFKNEPEALRVLENAWNQELKGGSVVDTFFQKFRGLEDVRRAMLVGQVATSMRNAWSQAGRISLSAFDETLQGAILGTGKGEFALEIKNGINIFQTAWRRMSPSGRRKLATILEENAGLIETTRLLSQPVHEVGMGNKLAKLVNTLNRTQEYYFRKLAFEAKLRTNLQRLGLNFETIDPRKIPVKTIEDATEYALEMTFASSGKGHAIKEFVKAWRQIGATVIQPFPRFAYANALPFILEHSPLGYLKAMSPSVLKALGSGHPEQFARAASRATIGTILFESAWQIRQSKYAGERWYQWKIGEDKRTGTAKNVDLRPYAPLSTYFFLAELFLHPERITGQDIASAIIGLNRISGSGLAIVDLLRTRKKETAFKTASRIAGEYMGGFSVPARTTKDILAELVPEEAIYRERRGSAPYQLVTPFAQNFPIISQLLPEARSPLKRGKLKSEKWLSIGALKLGPSIRQLTGVSGSFTPFIQREINKLGIDYSRIYPRTGVPEADRVLSSYMAPLSEWIGFKLLTNPRWEGLSPEKKKLFLVDPTDGVFREIRAYAMEELKRKRPDLYKKIKTHGISDDWKSFIEKQFGQKIQ